MDTEDVRARPYQEKLVSHGTSSTHTLTMMYLPQLEQMVPTTFAEIQMAGRKQSGVTLMTPTLRGSYASLWATKASKAATKMKH